MNFEKVSQLFSAHFYANYTALPYRLNDSTMLVDPTDSYTGKTVDQVNDFIEVFIFPLDASRAMLNGASNGRWVRGFIRINAYDKQVTGDTAVNGVQNDKMLGVVDGIYSEKTISDASVSIRFEAASGPFRVGINEEYQRYEGYIRIPFRAVFV